MAEEKDCLIDPETGVRFPTGGCLISNESDLPKFGASRLLQSKDMPPSVDLRQFMTPIESQGQLNACVGNALAGAYEFLIMKNSKKHVDVSRLFIYYNARLKSGYQEYNMADRGAYIRSAIAGLAEFGCCKEKSYPYNPAYTDQKPPYQCYAEAKNYRIKHAMQVEPNLEEMKACLAEGYPFAFGLQLFQSFSMAGINKGRIAMPNPNESQASQHGHHAMLAVGYSDLSKCFIVRNSWGENWGDHGYCYIPYGYMANPKYCSDLHAIKLVADDSRRQRTENNIPNPYNWNVDKKKKNFIPPNYPEQDFHYTFFWKHNDMFNYFNMIHANGNVHPFVWKNAHPVPHIHYPYKMAGDNDKPQMQFILWIDSKSEGNINIVKQLTSDNNVRVTFCETLPEGESHMKRLMNKIKSSSTFQIVCRGYYKNENKNPLDLLQFLNSHELNHIPVIVFTQDKSGLQHHLQKQAPSIGINDWQQRLVIIVDSEKLIQKIKENMTKNNGSNSH